MSGFRSFLPLLAFTLALGGGTAVCRAAGEQSESASVSGGSLYRAPLMNNPRTLDPAHVEDIYGDLVVQQVFDGLIQYSPELFVVPALAADWRVENAGRTYRFFLRKDARFHNGRILTASDAVFSLTRLLRAGPSILPHLLEIRGARDYLEGRADRVAGLVAADDSTLVVELDRAHVPFLTALGAYQAKIVPREEVEGREEAFRQAPVGTGPFRFLSWKRDESIRLQAFADYFGGKPLLDGVDFVIYPGAEVEKAAADFKTGRLEEMPVLPKIRQSLEEHKDLVWVHRPVLSLLFYGLNCQDPRFKDPDLRLALSLAVDRERLAREVYGGQFAPAASLFPPGLPGHAPGGRSALAQMERARQCLARATRGNAGALGPIEIVSNSQSPLAKAELEFIRKSWAELGIVMEAKFIPDWTAFERYLRSENLQLYRYAWFADIPDPDAILRPLFSSGSPTNFMRFQDAEVDELLQRAVGVVDPVERARLYQDIESRILDFSPLITLAYLTVDTVYRPEVKGVQVGALGAQAVSYHDISLQETSPR
jgi:ABC-type transport system substrate-binding protein